MLLYVTLIYLELIIYFKKETQLFTLKLNKKKTMIRYENYEKI